VLTLRDALADVEAHNANSSGEVLPLSRGSQWRTALAAWIAHATLVLSCVLVACKYMPSDSDNHSLVVPLQEHPSWWLCVGWLLAGYDLCVFLSRGWLVGPWVVFEAQWCCNHAQLLAGLGMATGKPLLVGIAVVGICCDVLCWFVDAFFLFVLRRKPPVGVMTFLTKPQRHVVQGTAIRGCICVYWIYIYMQCTHVCVCVCIGAVVTTLPHFWFMPQRWF
jgi:hypothetical protein